MTEKKRKQRRKERKPPATGFTLREIIGEINADKLARAIRR